MITITFVGGTWDGTTHPWHEYMPHVRMPKRVPLTGLIGSVSSDLPPEWPEEEDYYAAKLSDGSCVWIECKQYERMVRLTQIADDVRAKAYALARDADTLNSRVMGLEAIEEIRFSNYVYDMAAALCRPRPQVEA